jgi:hypothetical protein
MAAHLISTRPAPSLCPRCERVTLTGVAEGLRTRVDITVVPSELYVRAILLRVRLYWLDPLGLAYLDRHRIRQAGHNRYPVLPQHRCDLSWPHEAIVQVVPQTDDTPPY